MERNLVIGIDGGGSHTRVMAANGRGEVVAYAEGGAANWRKDKNAIQHVQAAIQEALRIAGCEAGNVVALTAGLAGLVDDNDLPWAQEAIHIPGMAGTNEAISDAWIAQAGALGGQPGIIVISGTGSVIFGINEEGEQLRNYDFNQYAYSTARHLAYEAVHRILAGEYVSDDEPLIAKVLRFWEVGDLAALSRQASKGFGLDLQACNKRFGQMAPLITEAAEAGTPLAETTCRMAAEQIATAVRLVGSRFSADTIEVALIGSVPRSRCIKEHIARIMAQPTMQDKVYAIKEPALSPAAGAVLMAFRQAGITVSEEMLRNLTASPHALVAET